MLNPYFFVVKSQGFPLNTNGIYGSIQRCVKSVLAGVHTGNMYPKHI